MRNINAVNTHVSVYVHTVEVSGYCGFKIHLFVNKEQSKYEHELNIYAIIL
jgi:hypothetical protein